ncbi:hypothetical protein MLD38_031144 [Melastoma candidum]|uniref:Uncharacterized protein n=1 Tax=Melastoma candidum TaxID=119954 RepID=A0ACB9MNN5_9MYRT|nr:hypothetical protein MLD38_031144 [Melastoma candidum]
MAVMSTASTGFQEPGSGRQRGGHWNSGSQAGAAETTGSDGAIVGKLLQPGSRGTGGTEKGGSATMKFGNAEKRWTPRRTGHHRCETRGDAGERSIHRRQGYWDAPGEEMVLPP